MRRTVLFALALLPAAAFAQARTVPCDPDNAGITLPAGFCATKFADSLQAPRHMVVAPNGDLLIVGNNRGGRGGVPLTPGSIFLLRDANNDGKAEMVMKLAPAHGSGIALANGYLYTSTGNRSIVRYKYTPGNLSLGPADTVVSEFLTGGHAAYGFVIIGSTIYMNVGSATNACEKVPPGVQGRPPRTPGDDPCKELETRAGIWTFDADKLGQKPTDGVRYATGVRNSNALTFDPRDNSIWVTMHGRDGLQPPPNGLWDGHDDAYGAENPGEQVNHIMKGDDFGWPYCYYSHETKSLVTAPEYGGDGKKTDRCAGKKSPEYAFPGHWAPNDMMFYTGTQFPAEFRNGAFVAFHGSWNRAPLPNAGFRVSFLPIVNGRVTGAHKDLATEFAMPNQQPGRDGRAHRPTGLAQGTDGSIYVSDDLGGTIYKISFRGVR